MIFRVSIIVLSIALFACSREPYETPNSLPEATAEGANTLGFKLNGEIWTPYGRYGMKVKQDGIGYNLNNHFHYIETNLYPNIEGTSVDQSLVLAIYKEATDTVYLHSSTNQNGQMQSHAAFMGYQSNSA